MQRDKTLGIRIQRREGRTFFVFHRDGSEVFELEEIPPFEVRRSEGGKARVGGSPSDADWSRTTLSSLRRAISAPVRKG